MCKQLKYAFSCCFAPVFLCLYAVSHEEVSLGRSCSRHDSPMVRTRTSLQDEKQQKEHF